MLKVRGREALFDTVVRGMYSRYDEEQPDLWLMRTIIAALLAVCMAIFPIAMPQAAALAGHSHQAVPVDHTHEKLNLEQASVHCEDAAVGVTSANEHGTASGDHDGGDGSSCCGTTACHPFQVISTLTIGARLPVIGVVQVTRDHQVSGVFSGRLDRPPRTV